MQTGQSCHAGHQNAIMRYCIHEGSFADLYTLPGVQYLPALLLPAALALHVWATETLGKVGSQQTVAQSQQCQDKVHELILQPVACLHKAVRRFTIHLSPLQAYDRLVIPDRLVKSGPYAWCQHPIYTSYMLLFCGLALWFGDERHCLYMLYFCWDYFRDCIQTEARLLQQAFGNEYIAYKEHTGSFLPRIF